MVRFCPVLFERDDGSGQQQVQKQAPQQAPEQVQQQQAQQQQQDDAAAGGLPIDLPYKMVFAVSCARRLPWLTAGISSSPAGQPAQIALAYSCCPTAMPSASMPLLPVPCLVPSTIPGPTSVLYPPTHPPIFHCLHPSGGHPGQRGAIRHPVGTAAGGAGPPTLRLHHRPGLVQRRPVSGHLLARLLLQVGGQRVVPEMARACSHFRSGLPVAQHTRVCKLHDVN